MTEHPQSENTDWNHQLYLAAKSADIEKMQRVLSHGADIDSRHGDNLTPILHAALNSSGPMLTKRVELCRFVLEQGANPNNTTRRGFASLHVAGGANDAELVDLLLDYGANPDVFSKTGKLEPEHHQTPLQECVLKNRIDAVKALLKTGSDPLLPDGYGKTLAGALGDDYHKHLKEVLEPYEKLPRVDFAGEFSKADLLQTNSDGLCPLDNPVVWRHWQQVEAQLAQRGESFSKDELLQKNPDDKSYLQTAVDARMLGAAIKHLNAQGQGMSVQDLLTGDAGFEQALTQRPVAKAVFTKANMKHLGNNAVLRNYQHMPEQGKKQLPGIYQLSESLRNPALNDMGR